MKTLSYANIVQFRPCYDPIKHIPENYSGTLAEILSLKQVPAKDRLWLIIRAELLSDKQIHTFALFCARQCEVNSTDPRVKECNDTVEAFLKGEGTKEQLSAAESAAKSANSAAWSAAKSAAKYAESAAGSAAKSAAGSAAASAAKSAAKSATSAAESAAESAAKSAKSAESAAESAWSAARSAESAAWSAAKEKQCEFLAELLTKGGMYD